jgi:hypothetical protein
MSCLYEVSKRDEMFRSQDGSALFVASPGSFCSVGFVLYRHKGIHSKILGLFNVNSIMISPECVALCRS